jgi:hypothetical protein
MFPVAAASVVERAQRRFGRYDAHEIEVQFDRFTTEVGGSRHRDPAFYQVPLTFYQVPLTVLGCR